MIETKDRTRISFIENILATLQANQTDETVISFTEETEPVSLLSVFQAARNSGKDRMFWSNHERTFSYVGIGVATKIIVDEVERYDTLEKKWNELLKKAIIHDPYKMNGTGLLGIGGMSFDPKKSTTDLWAHFPSSQLTVPELFVVETDGRYFMTMNQIVSKSSQAEAVENHFNQLQSIVQGVKPLQKTSHQVVNKVEVDPNGWKQAVEDAVTAIINDKAKKIVMAREMKLNFDKEANIAHLIQKLLVMQANSYVFAMEHDGHCFLGATPERLVQVQGKQLLSACIAGTIPRGKTAEEDAQLGAALLNDNKNREEHDYVVQMIRDQISAYCKQVDMPAEPILHPLKNLQHLYTPVEATLKERVSIFEIIRALHPTPALGGLPKEASLAFIRDNERLDRGWYGAPVGWLDSNQNGEFVVAIRSGLIRGTDASLFAGCGVMRDSDAEMEYEETNVKFLPMLHVVEDEHETY